MVDWIQSIPPVVELLHLVGDLLQSLAHEVGPLRAAVVPLRVLQETEEYRVHGHGVDTWNWMIGMSQFTYV